MTPLTPVIDGVPDIVDIFLKTMYLLNMRGDREEKRVSVSAITVASYMAPARKERIRLRPITQYL